MNFVFGNTLGLWALLGIPAVLLVNFLQERSKRVRVSTLFLLERIAPQSVSGARFDRLRNSIPLWMQLLAVLLLTWILCEPRWIKEDARQTIVVVVDSSVSMSVFKDKAIKILERKAKEWSRVAVRTDWHLMQTDIRKARLYAGDDWKEMLKTFEAWKPLKGTHEVDGALVVARGLVKGAGMVVFITDHKTKLSDDVALLSVGEEVDNVGVAGIKVNSDKDERIKWEIVVKNYGQREAARSWWIEFTDGRKSEPNQIKLEGGQVILLAGELPPGEKRAWLRLEEDRFRWDDSVPMQMPKDREVYVKNELESENGRILEKLLSALPDVAINNVHQAGLLLAELGTGADAVAGNALLVISNSDLGDTGVLDGSLVVAEDHELTRGLNWMGLLTPKPREITLSSNDIPLLWKGDRVLAFLRQVKEENGTVWNKLILNWELERSNAYRHAALLVMLHRFVDVVRNTSDTSWAGNFECGQEVNIVSKEMRLSQEGEVKKFDGKLPDEVGFFEVKQGDKIWLEGAICFADSREADFSECIDLDLTDGRARETAMKQSEADRWTPFWMLLMMGCLVVAWSKVK